MFVGALKCFYLLKFLISINILFYEKYYIKYFLYSYFIGKCDIKLGFCRNIFINNLDNHIEMIIVIQGDS